ncbi:hypothetical protein POM88_007445 [Heracleum sosnowskyi]|uniref:DUF6598 domain-containing protein n=1 Tax=Heracleum sosnowskyi TaxID=360622 RepID=A0AAD8J5H1_9APIA|nr:hypothetical protein POM88_007444 [Heracleum sosnowskyi]KAK1397582.1 hypothetical protein POM88_007445 [Heracleum sosnowskyi]
MSLLEPKEPEGWEGLSLMEVFRIVYMGEEQVMPNKQIGWIKIKNDDRFQYLYKVEDVDPTMESIECMQDLNLTVKGPTISFSEVKIEFDLFRRGVAFKDCIWLQWDPYPSDVRFMERRLSSRDGTELISIMMGLFGNATVASLEVKLKHYSAATTVYGLVCASNSKLDIPRARSMLFLKKHDTGTKVGNDGIIPLSKSSVGVPLGSMLNVDISLHYDGQHHAFSLCFEALLNGKTAKGGPSEENAEIQVTVIWDADEDSNQYALYDEDSNFSAPCEQLPFPIYDEDEDEDTDFSVSDGNMSDKES